MNVFDYCEKHTKEHHSLTYYLARLFGNRENIKYFFLFYSYLRIVDDLIDDQSKDNQEKIKYLDDQQAVLTEKVEDETDDLEKNIIREIIRFDRNYSGFLTKRILDMFEIFRFDINRLGKYVSRDELFRYYHLESEVSLLTILFFIIPSSKIKIYETVKIGVLSKVIHTIRDLDEDLSEGVINIPLEYKDKSNEYIEWIKTEIPKWIYSGRKGILQVNNMKYAIVCVVNYNRYLSEFYSAIDKVPGFLIKIFYGFKVILEIPVTVFKMKFQ